MAQLPQWMDAALGALHAQLCPEGPRAGLVPVEKKKSTFGAQNYFSVLIFSEALERCAGSPWG